MKGRKPIKPGPKTNNSNPHPKAGGTLDRNVRDTIGKQLRAMYDDLAKQAVPDRFTELLKKLDRQDDQGKH
jgi:hypothetical protein